MAGLMADRSDEFGCFTGDCTHVAQAECDAAIRASWVEQADEIDRLREDAERWRFLRQFLGVTRWDLSPASQLTAALFRIPAVVGRSDATVEEIVDAARPQL